jgi:uncharacterized protein
VRLGDNFFDAAPISVLVDTWLTDLSAHVGYAVEWERFRPNFFVKAAPEFAQAESDLADAELQFGSLSLRVRCPIERCVVPTYHLRGEAGDPEILRFVAQRRNTWMGVYCDVVAPGIARTGDPVTTKT